jgi:TonB-linked SusC/RagA family outer membrane protein
MKCLYKNLKQNSYWFKFSIPLLSFMMLFNVSLMAQSIDLKGVVTDAGTNESLPGVTVKVEGNNLVGTTTDLNGNFKLKVTAKTEKLSFSFVGYVTQSVAIAGKAVINVALVADVKRLDEVVVIGYGTMKRRDLTGSISSVSGKALQSIPVTSTAQAITGKMAGVQVTTTDGSPDADVMIRVRGGGSVTQDNSPLYIVDGFPVNKISDIDPNDIGSIDVLKDASSTAIYGARGANGVVIITTKNPTGGKTTVTYNGYVQVKTLPKKLGVLSPYEYALLQYELASLKGSSGISAYNNYFGSFDDIDIYKNQIGTDWQRQVFGPSGLNDALSTPNHFSQSHNLSIMGGNAVTKYNLSITQTKDPGLMIGTGNSRTNLNFRLSHELLKTLKIEFNTRFSQTTIDGAGTSDYNKSSTKIRNAVTYRPMNGLADVIPIDVNDLGSAIDVTSGLVDPVTLAQQSYRKQLQFAMNMNGALSWNIMSNLVARSEFGVDYHYNKDNWFYGPLTLTAKNNGNLPYAQIINTTNPGYRLSNTLNYSIKKLTGKDELTLLVGQEILSQNSTSVTSTARMFQNAAIDPVKAFAFMSLGSQEYTNTNESANNNLASFFGRANYSLMQRYMLTLTLRADGSTKFAPGHQWGYFPAAALAWRISDEKFMKKQNIISSMKFRASIGEAGNNRMNDDMWRALYALGSTKSIGFNEVPQPYYQAASSILYNPDLKWETTITRNGGLDFGLFKDRINGSLDVYWNTTKDLLIQSTIPSNTGYSSQMRNIGQTSNRGVELTLNANIINKSDFTFAVSVNIGMNKSKIDKLDGVDSKPFNSGWASTELRETDDYTLRVGQAVGQIYGYVSDGMYTVNDFNYNAVTRKYTLKPGIPNDASIISSLNFGPGSMKLKKLSSDTSMIIAQDKDRTIIGNTNPLHSGGINFNATYKGFDLSLFFNWVYGNKVYNANKIDFTTYWNRTFTNMLSSVDYKNRYKYLDLSGNLVTDPTALTTLNKDATMWSPFMGRPIVTSWAIEDGSFLRLNNVTLGYSLPKKMIGKVGMTQCRLYFTVYNAWILTNYTGYDPEVSTVRGSPLTPGVDYSAYPKARSYTLGINLSF